MASAPISKPLSPRTDAHHSCPPYSCTVHACVHAQVRALEDEAAVHERRDLCEAAAGFASFSSSLGEEDHDAEAAGAPDADADADAPSTADDADDGAALAVSRPRAASAAATADRRRQLARHFVMPLLVKDEEVVRLECSLIARQLLARGDETIDESTCGNCWEDVPASEAVSLCHGRCAFSFCAPCAARTFQLLGRKNFLHSQGGPQTCRGLQCDGCRAPTHLDVVDGLSTCLLYTSPSPRDS